MNDITICLPYFENAGMLKEQCRRLAALPETLKARLRLIVVDDGSPEHPAVWQDVGLPFSLYRIQVNVRWNQDAARNIAAHHAETPWLLLTDIDHIPPEETLEALVRHTYDGDKVYRFMRMTLEKTQRLTPYKPHPNSWFMGRSLYWKIGGYDESFAGLYGTDADFRNRAAAAATAVEMMPHHLIRVPRDTIKDASTPEETWGRKTPTDAALGPMIQKRNLTRGWQPKVLSFPYDLVR